MELEINTPDDDDARIQEIFRILEETGCLIWFGLDKNGEPVYRLTEKCKEVFPDLYAMHTADINRVANELWQLGVVDLIFNEGDSDRVTFTANNYQRYIKVKDKLTEEQRNFLDVIVSESLLGEVERLNKFNP